MPDAESLYHGFAIIIGILLFVGWLYVLVGALGDSSEEDDAQSRDAGWLEHVPLSEQALFAGMIMIVVALALRSLAETLLL